MSTHRFEIIRIAAFSLAVLLEFSLGACKEADRLGPQMAGWSPEVAGEVSAPRR